MEKLLIPVYLNQRIVFDMVAMLQDGLSTVTEVSQKVNTSSSSNDIMFSNFGIGEVLSSLFKIDVSSSSNKETNIGESRNVSEAKVHTPSSLFFKLRSNLTERGLITFLDGSTQVNPGDIVEFEADLKLNPIIESVSTYLEFMYLAETFQTNSKNNSSSNQVKIKMEKFIKDLRAGNTIDLIADGLASNSKAVVTLDINYLSDPSMSDLVDGHFKVIGKIIRVLENSDDAISLIRKTAYSKMPAGVIEKSFLQIDQLGHDQGFKVPRIVWQIDGPAIQVIPIAIYA
ncbi:hypothetical protein [Vibrio metschnikovii]|uniref:DUF6414 family protein n=1 Tax=Vibrio metschnikovii TaxID=28172 RepID=UPI002FC5C98B